MPDTIRAAIIGCDTSHCNVFTESFNDEKSKTYVPGVNVVAAWPSFSEDIASSRDRVKGITEQLRDKHRVKIVDKIEDLLPLADAFLIESVDGRRHLKELKAIAAAGKPVFIDKPFAASLADAQEMARIIKDAKLPCFSSSALRFEKNLQALVKDEARGKIMGCDAYAPASLEPTNPGFFWYGIHGVEILFTIMGPGCRSVRCTSTKDGDMSVGLWKDSRVGSMRGLRAGAHEYGAVAYCEKKVMNVKPDAGSSIYAGLLKEIAQFLRTGKAPVPIDETLEIMAYIDASLTSSKADGADAPLKL